MASRPMISMEMETHDTIPAPLQDTIPAPPPAFVGGCQPTVLVAEAERTRWPMGQWIGVAGAVALATMVATMLSGPVAHRLTPADRSHEEGASAPRAVAEPGSRTDSRSTGSQASAESEAGPSRPGKDTDDLAADRPVAVVGQPRTGAHPEAEAAPGRTLASDHARRAVATRPGPAVGAAEPSPAPSKREATASTARRLSALPPVAADVARATEAARVTIPEIIVLVSVPPRSGSHRGRSRTHELARSGSRRQLGALRTAPTPTITRETPHPRARRPATIGRSTRHELTASEIQGVVSGAQDRVRQCYDTALRRSGSAQAARALLFIQIDPSGEVVRARSRGTQIGRLHSCLEGAARRWMFPESRSGARVPIPLNLSPRR